MHSISLTSGRKDYFENNKHTDTNIHIIGGGDKEFFLPSPTIVRLGLMPIGAFYDKEVTNVIDCLKKEVPLYIILIGKLKY